MTSTKISIKSPCNQDWGKMTPNAKGNFCTSCAKNVIDFSKLNNQEITSQIKSSDKNICARVTSNQLNPIYHQIPNSKSYSFPYSNFAAGIILAISIISCQPSTAKTPISETTTIELNNSKPPNIDTNLFVKQKDNITTEIIKGKVISEENKAPVENAKITLITLQKTYSTYSKKDGSYTLEIPEDILKEKNVIRVTYDEIKKSKNSLPLSGFEMSNHIVSKEDLTTTYTFKAFTEYFMMGEVVLIENPTTPIVLRKGIQIKYKTYIKGQKGKKSSCTSNHENYFFFEQEYAKILLGEIAEGGLILIY